MESNNELTPPTTLDHDEFDHMPVRDLASESLVEIPTETVGVIDLPAPDDEPLPVPPVAPITEVPGLSFVTENKPKTPEAVDYVLNEGESYVYVARKTIHPDKTETTHVEKWKLTGEIDKESGNPIALSLIAQEKDGVTGILQKSLSEGSRRPEVQAALEKQYEQTVRRAGHEVLEAAEIVEPAEISSIDKEAAQEKYDAGFLGSEFRGMIGTVFDIRKQHPHDREGYIIQEQLLKRLDYYKMMHESQKISEDAYTKLIAMTIGASTDNGAVKRIYNTLESSGVLSAEEMKGVLNFTADIDKRVRSEMVPHKDVIMQLISDIRHEARDKGENTPYGRTLLAMGGGLATHLQDINAAQDVGGSVWGSRIYKK